jgi:transposase-like protein
LNFSLKGDAMLRRQSENEEFWRWVLVEFVRSGLSVREFCHREGISEPSFYSWRKKITQLDAGGQPNFPNLIPVRVVPTPGGHGVTGRSKPATLRARASRLHRFSNDGVNRMANHLKVAEVLTIQALFDQGWSQRRIARELGINRETVARHLKSYSKPAKAPTESVDPNQPLTTKRPPGRRTQPAIQNQPVTAKRPPGQLRVRRG